MICPVCGEKMREIEKHGVSVDICPSCKGVWLDRGELEKIVELVSNAEPMPPAQDHPGPVSEGPQEQGAVRSSTTREASPRANFDPRWDGHRRRHDDDDDDDDHNHHEHKPPHREGERYFGHDAPHGYDDQRQYHGKPYKKKSWFSEIFEAFGD